MDNRISAKLTQVLLLLDKAEILISEIKDTIGSTPTQIDLIRAEIPFAINYPNQEEKSNAEQINGSYGIKEIDYV